jgi:hypothetical protein
MKRAWKPSRQVLWLNALSLLICIFALYRDWFVFTIYWDPPRVVGPTGADLENRQNSIQRDTFFAAFSSGQCQISDQISAIPARLHRMQPDRRLVLCAYLGCAAVGWIILAVGMISSRAGWKVALGTFGGGVIIALILVSLLPPVSVAKWDIFTLNEYIPNWLYLSSESNTSTCYKGIESDLKRGDQRSQNGPPLIHASGYADWRLKSLLPGGPLWLSAAFLLALRNVQAWLWSLKRPTRSESVDLPGS